MMEGHRIFSPNGEAYVEFGEDFGEIRMGSPEFGKIRIRRVDVEKERKFRLFGTKPRREIELGEDLFSGAVVFSPDSRFVALEQLVEDHRLRTQLLVVDVELCKIFFAVTPSVGTVTPVRWEGPRKIVYSEWQFPGERVLRHWVVPG